MTDFLSLDNVAGDFRRIWESEYFINSPSLIVFGILLNVI
jgi:hypothetical protein